MKKLKITGFFLIMIACSLSVFAELNKDKELPPWMEDIKVNGRSTYLVPKGAVREIIGSQVVVEPPNEYVARRIYEIERHMEERLNKITEDQENIKAELEALKKTLDGIEITKELEYLRNSIEKLGKKMEKEEERKLDEFREKIKELEGGLEGLEEETGQ